MTTILLVEDNPDDSDMLIRRLERRNYSVVLATSGEEALQMARTESPDLILMDMRLPGMDGWAVTERLRSDPVTEHMLIIGLSAHALTADRDKAIQAGCNDYETKPIEFPRLLAKIEAILEKKLAD